MEYIRNEIAKLKIKGKVGNSKIILLDYSIDR